MRIVITIAALLAVAAVGLNAQGYDLTVTGSGQSGSTLVFSVKDKTGVPQLNQVAFLGISALKGKTEFPFVTVDLGWPIFACGMGSLNHGPAKHRITVPELPIGFSLKMYAQSVIVTPKGGGYIATTSNVVEFVVFN